MNLHKSSGSSAKGRTIPGLGGSRHHLQQRRGNRRRPSSPAFLKCSMNLFVGFLVVLVITYLTVLSSFLGIEKDHERKPKQSQMLGRPESVKGVTNHIENGEDDGRLTIAVASTVTGCGSDPFIDGAAVLKYSLDVHSRSATSKFKYRTYIFYHPDAKECVLPLGNLGYTLLERSTPIKVDEIGGNGGLRERIVTNGCCGEN